VSLLQPVRFSRGAVEYAKRVPQRIILIDGAELTRLMMQYGVGVRTDRTVEFKRIDLNRDGGVTRKGMSLRSRVERACETVHGSMIKALRKHGSWCLVQNSRGLLLSSTHLSLKVIEDCKQPIDGT
jgi:hypothetical protein